MHSFIYESCFNSESSALTDGKGEEHTVHRMVPRHRAVRGHKSNSDLLRFNIVDLPDADRIHYDTVVQVDVYE